MLTVLVVEDNEQIQNVFKSILEEIGEFEVIQALTIKQAKELFEANSSRLDVIVMDRSLGYGIDTDYFVVTIRKSGFNKPIVAFSSDPDTRKEQVELGCSHQLPKPMGIEDAIQLFSLFGKKE
jgi:CheY-like chemotaxis protein